MTLQRPLPGHGEAFDPAPASSDISSDGARRWICVSCRASNALDADACATCGSSFASLLGGDTAPVGVRSRDIALAVREIAVLAALFVLWKVASTFSLMQQSGAFSRARWIWHLERSLRLPSEVALQNGVLSHPLVVQSLDVFYLAAHIGATVLLLAWLFVRHRSRYRQWRNVLVPFTGLSLLVQFISVAPPRLLPRLGFVDTAARYHQSAYHALGPGLVDQLSSMPSIHVGWSAIVAVAVIATSASRWRWLVLAHPALTMYAVVATANHFWLDGVAAVLLVAVVLAVSAAMSTRRCVRSAALP